MDPIGSMDHGPYKPWTLSTIISNYGCWRFVSDRELTLQVRQPLCSPAGPPLRGGRRGPAGPREWSPGARGPISRGTAAEPGGRRRRGGPGGWGRSLVPEPVLWRRRGHRRGRSLAAAKTRNAEREGSRYWCKYKCNTCR